MCDLLLHRVRYEVWLCYWTQLLAMQMHMQMQLSGLTHALYPNPKL